MSVPTEAEDELLASLEAIQITGAAKCRLCGDLVDIADADNWGDVFDALAEHGEQREDHVWDDIDGWTLRGDLE